MCPGLEVEFVCSHGHDPLRALQNGLPDADGDLSSFTLTLNYKPLPNVKIQPEIRYDRTSYAGGFDGKEDRIVVGAGISYLF